MRKGNKILIQYRKMLRGFVRVIAMSNVFKDINSYCHLLTYST